MKFYIVTPTYNALGWLQRCVQSVADQACEQVEVHHHVQDGGSADGTPEWLAAWQQEHAATPGYTLTYQSAPDNGMYDAINKAWAQMPADADVTAHLNSDEQYLPAGLKKIAAELAAHPKADIAISSYVIFDAQNRYICHRRPIRPYKWISRTVCEIVTCACFHRVPGFVRHGVRFNPHWRSIGDLVMYSEIVNTSPRFLVLPNVVASAFAVTGSNLAWTDVTRREWPEYYATVPALYRALSKLAAFCSNLKRRSCDLWYPAPTLYDIYHKDAAARTRHLIKRPTSHWGCRTEGVDE